MRVWVHTAGGIYAGAMSLLDYVISRLANVIDFLSAHTGVSTYCLFHAL